MLLVIINVFKIVIFEIVLVLDIRGVCRVGGILLIILNLVNEVKMNINKVVINVLFIVFFKVNYWFFCYWESFIVVFII